MNYDLKFDVPTKYLGTEVNNLIAKLTPADAKKMESIPINGLMTGSFAAPKFTTDLKVATTNLVTQLVKQQKDKYINQGLSQLGNAAGLPTKTDSTGTTVPKTKEEVKEEVKEGCKR